MQIEQTQNPWNSLEVIKLIISCLTPIVVAYLAFLFNRVIKRNEKAQWTNQKILEKRIQLYDLIVPKLNDLLCYYSYVGNWKEISPPEIIEIKRFLDKNVYIYAPLFTQGVLEKYNLLIDLCFEKFTGWGNDAKINSLYERREEFNKGWKVEWKKYFSKSYIDDCKDDEKIVRSDIANIRQHYLDLMEELRTNLEIYKSGTYHKGEFPSINY